MDRRYGHQRARQVAYFVPDATAAARAHSAAFGSGPFFVAEHIPLSLSLYRGKPAPLDHTSAYGQWGDVMVEFVQQNNEGPSVFQDLFSGGRQGFHHIALIVEDLKGSIREFEAKGYEVGWYAEVGPETGFAMIDFTRELGHFIELYEPSAALIGVYELVQSASVGFDGTDPIRHFTIG